MLEINQPSLVKQFNIHGDNIVECERTFSLILNSLGITESQVEGPTGSVVCPTFYIELSAIHSRLSFTFFPGFGRWAQNILSYVRDRGAPLREAADAIITEVISGAETVLLALEYSGALPAGNQAWQRSGRAYSFAKAKIPYFYIAELGGFELGADRAQKAARLPNPAVPFSYLSFSASLDTPVVPVFVPSPGASVSAIAFYGGVFGSNDFSQLLRVLILGQDHQEIIESLEKKVLELVQLLASARKRKDTLSPEQWLNAYKNISTDQPLTNFILKEVPLTWSKTAYIEGLTATARQLMSLAAKYAVGLTSTSLPLCVLAPTNRQKFAAELSLIYPSLPDGFIEWLARDTPLTICWIMGFKPRGDDARPDRGLPPFARMLIGDKADLLTVVYGPAPATTWPLFARDPITLMQRNGLWEAILTASDAVLLDSSTMDASHPKAYIGSHWVGGLPTIKESSVLVDPVPIRIGENDVDTVLHLLFARLGNQRVFEGLCNPPGGDWSGISLLTPDHALELRWLSLPRVTSANAKRPDHIFEIFNLFQLPIVFIVESKERAGDIENQIGSRLIQYVRDLIASPPNVQRSGPTDFWNHQTSILDVTSVQFASAAAFVMTNSRELQAVAGRAAADVILGFEFSSDGRSCVIHTHPSTQLGKVIADFMVSISGHNKNIHIRMA